MAHKSYRIAVSILEGFYANSPDSDIISRADMFRAMGRDSHDRKANVLLWSRLSILRQYNLISTNYIKGGGAQVIGSITLTKAGRYALGRSVDSKGVNPSAASKPSTSTGELPGHIVTPESVLADVRILQRQNPSFDVKLVFASKANIPTEQVGIDDK